jgi:hypothetical protein
MFPLEDFVAKKKLSRAEKRFTEGQFKFLDKND